MPWWMVKEKKAGGLNVVANPRDVTNVGRIDENARRKSFKSISYLALTMRQSATLTFDFGRALGLQHEFSLLVSGIASSAIIVKIIRLSWALTQCLADGKSRQQALYDGLLRSR